MLSPFVGVRSITAEAFLVCQLELVAKAQLDLVAERAHVRQHIAGIDDDGGDHASVARIDAQVDGLADGELGRDGHVGCS